jgi:hypothetical protein
MVVGLSSVVQHGHDVWVVVLIVVVKGVEKDTQAVPFVRAAEHGSLEPFGRRKPESDTVGANASSACHSELNFDFPPIKGSEKVN